MLLLLFRGTWYFFVNHSEEDMWREVIEGTSALEGLVSSLLTVHPVSHNIAPQQWEQEMGTDSGFVEKSFFFLIERAALFWGNRRLVLSRILPIQSPPGNLPAGCLDLQFVFPEDGIQWKTTSSGVTPQLPFTLHEKNTGQRVGFSQSFCFQQHLLFLPICLSPTFSLSLYPTFFLFLCVVPLSLYLSLFLFIYFFIDIIVIFRLM